ncbi:MAG: glycerol-3-phosphate dehydrogenase/oxidase [Candidatus Nanopelagicales bacterium]
MDDRLNDGQRRQALDRLRATSPEDPLDLLIVGGGVVGCGAALDAASRGLSVGLVEQRDLASGTSSRSSRLAHGGLRYLENREFGLVHEALTERGLLLDRLAPHLVRPLAFVMPLSGPAWEKSYVGAGVTLYDMLSRVGAYGGQLPRPRTLSRAAVSGVAPSLAGSAVKGGVRFHDAQIDDARHTLATARSAVAHGAAVVTRCEAVAAVRDERVGGMRVRADGEEFDVHARCVLSATGVWTDEFRHRVGAAGDETRVRQAKGVHLIVPRDRIRSTTAVIARTPSSVLFLLPWGDKWLVGTTDTDYEGELADPRATADDVDYLLDQANRWLDPPLTREDLVGVYCGLRPLVAAELADGQTAALSREHVVLQPEPGLIMIAGGKYTTYRVMARDAVDTVVAERAAFVAGDEVGECRTHELPVVGAAGFPELWQARSRMAREAGLSEDLVVHLLRRHGDRIRRVTELIAIDPDLGTPLHPDAPYVRAEVVVAVTDEGARTVEDVLVRRTRVALETRDVGHAALPTTVAIMADLLGWDDAEADAQTQRFVTDWPDSWQDEIAATGPIDTEEQE